MSAALPLHRPVPGHSGAVPRIEADFQAARRTQRNATLLWGGVLLVCIYVAALVSEASPAAILAGLPRIGEYFWRTLPTFRWEVFFADWETEGSFASWMYRADKWAWLLFETAQMALLATLAGTLGALALCFPAARNMAPNGWVYHLSRRFLEVCRTVPEIVFALIFVWAFGIGPLAGILAIAIHTLGANGKLFAEVVENAEPGPVEGVRAAGGNWFHRARFGVLPQVAPNFLSYALLRFEVNVRGASVIGFVGAGGIGAELYQVIAFNYYEEISAIVVLIIIAVAMIDVVSEKLRMGLNASATRGSAG